MCLLLPQRVRSNWRLQPHLAQHMHPLLVLCSVCLVSSVVPVYTFCCSNVFVVLRSRACALHATRAPAVCGPTIFSFPSYSWLFLKILSERSVAAQVRSGPSSFGFACFLSSSWRMLLSPRTPMSVVAAVTGSWLRVNEASVKGWTIWRHGWMLVIAKPWPTTNVCSIWRPTTKVVLRGFACVSEFLRAKDQDFKLAKQAFVASFIAELRNHKYLPESHQCFSDRVRRDQREKGMGKGKGKQKKGAGKGKHKPPQAKRALAPANPQGCVADPLLALLVRCFLLRIGCCMRLFLPSLLGLLS